MSVYRKLIYAMLFLQRKNENSKRYKKNSPTCINLVVQFDYRLKKYLVKQPSTLKFIVQLNQVVQKTTTSR